MRNKKEENHIKKLTSHPKASERGFLALQKWSFDLVKVTVEENLKKRGHPRF
jgi:hypothetical protein